MKNTTIDRFRRGTVTVHYSSIRMVRKETRDEDTERKIESVGR